MNIRRLPLFLTLISFVFCSSYVLAYANHDIPKTILEATVMWGLKNKVKSPAKTRTVKNPGSIGRAQTRKKIVALTFDDGPHQKHTREILDILKQNDVKATFFVIGENAQNHPDIIKEMSADGNIIGNHSYSHPRLNTLSDDEIETELTKTSNLIYKTIKKSPVLFRPPYGSQSRRSIRTVNNFGFTTITWSYMSKDYELDKTTSEKIAREIINNTAPGSIIGLHDGGGNREKTVAALPIIIHNLKKKGYEFLTVSELLSIDAYHG
jgi:peptidoglycan-N-acetylglucosamine deacetylase